MRDQAGYLRNTPDRAQLAYGRTRDRVEAYFDRTATAAWERLTSDAPVSKVRETVRAGRDRMRAAMLTRLGADLRGMRVLDAGCGAGQMTAELALRGAQVVAVDISPSLIEIASRRLPGSLTGQVQFLTGDMLDANLGGFDAVVAMDSLIYYDATGIGRALAGLERRTAGPVVFTVPPRTPLLMAMWYAGKLFPRGDRSPVMIPQNAGSLARAARAEGVAGKVSAVERVTSGFYISQMMELRS